MPRLTSMPALAAQGASFSTELTWRSPSTRSSRVAASSEGGSPSCSRSVSSECTPTRRCDPLARAAFSRRRCVVVSEAQEPSTYTRRSASQGHSSVPSARSTFSASSGGGCRVGRGGGTMWPFTRRRKDSHADEDTAMTLMAELWSRSLASQLWQTSQGQRGLILFLGSSTATASMVHAAWKSEAARATPARSAQRDPAGKLTSVFIPRYTPSVPSARRQTTVASTTWPDLRCQKGSWPVDSQSAKYRFNSSRLTSMGEPCSTSSSLQKCSLSGATVWLRRSRCTKSRCSAWSWT
mmetsp:Transcript_55079/g.160750  ORF Transcript_55079/g.160750 Transcript_55079/m.160750 type:complete len:295 (+) Transcript_55079:347-1231(+)